MKILAAMEIADCDFEHMDMDVLVGALLKLKLWDSHHHNLNMQGKRRFLDDLRADGIEAIKKYEAEIESENESFAEERLILRIYQNELGLWLGRLFCGEAEIGQCGVYGSADEVRTAARQSGILCDSIEIFQKDA